jgi:hypothetical protein
MKKIKEIGTLAFGFIMMVFLITLTIGCILWAITLPDLVLAYVSGGLLLLVCMTLSGFLIDRFVNWYMDMR